MLPYFLLALSIGLELFATTMLKASDGFTRPLKTIACVFGYVGSFYTLTHVLKYIPLSVTYATWSGVGLVVRQRSFRSLSLVRAIICTLFWG